MANISFIVKQKLESAIKILCRDFSSHVKRPGKDFSRNRKLPFEEMIRFFSLCKDNVWIRNYSATFQRNHSSFQQTIRVFRIVPL